MKKIVGIGWLMAIMALLNCGAASAQALLSTSPGFVKEINATGVDITMDATKGNKGLLGYTPVTDVYVHIGAITTASTGPTDWKYVQTTWPVNNAANQTVSLGADKWKFSLPANLRTYFGITNSNEKIIRIAILFRNGTGFIKQTNSDGSDTYIPVDTSGLLRVKFTAPPTEPRYVPWAEPIAVSLGQTLPIEAVSNGTANIDMYLNGTLVASGTNTTLVSGTPTLSQTCQNQLKIIASDGTTTVTDSLSFFIPPATTPVATLPAGLQDGINYLPGDTSVTLVLLAPKKKNIFALGSFNNWQIDCNKQMTMTPDSLRFWTTINGLTPGTIYQFQYFVDGIITTTDPYCEMILDPWNDASITAATFPNLPAYPVGQTGIVGTFQTAAPSYTWTTNGYTRPDKKGLNIYEVHLRDFLATHDWNTMRDTLNYLKNLGVNCVELMPFTEFDGNNSWGYNPAFFFAPDKYYGPKNDLKKFVDECHAMGISVVLDAVLNQTTGANPLAQLYWDGGKPAIDNPWLNRVAKHPFNVFEDFNHESEATKYFVKRFMKHWLQEYKLDGFRWDLAKGFTQVNSGNDVGLWGNYDASRVAIWKHYYDTMMAYSPNTYCILEFLGGDQEESTYANYGMLLWGKMTDEYGNLVEGTAGSSIERSYHKNRPGYNVPGLIAYAESHDEERTIRAALDFGNSTNSAHNVKTLNIALSRVQAMMPMLLLIPGPKMLWQFEELGYDFGINYCQNTNTYNSNCRVDPKPIRWNYFTVAGRKAIHNVTAALQKLRLDYPSVFTNETVTTGTFLGSNLIKKIVLDDAALKVSAVSNFNVSQQTTTINFPSNGWWYSMFGTDSVNISGNSLSVTLPAGGFKVYTSKKVSAPVLNTEIANFTTSSITKAAVAPNPATNNATLFLEMSSSAKTTIQILSVTGQVLNTQDLGNLNQDYHEIDLTNSIKSLAPGMYHLNIIADGLRNDLKFIKQ
jgi:1,4-alpha-glucan branching enzyme